MSSHIQRIKIVLATEEISLTQQVSHRLDLSKRSTKVNGSYHGDSPLLKPTEIQIATNPCQVQPTDNIGNLTCQDDVLGYGLQFLLSINRVLPVFQNSNNKLQRSTVSLPPALSRCGHKINILKYTKILCFITLRTDTRNTKTHKTRCRLKKKKNAKEHRVYCTRLYSVLRMLS